MYQSSIIFEGNLPKSLVKACLKRAHQIDRVFFEPETPIYWIHLKAGFWNAEAQIHSIYGNNVNEVLRELRFIRIEGEKL
jgi:hypothetical protein